MIELERKQARRQVSLSFIACFKHINIGGKLHIMNIMDSEQENCVGILLNHCEYILICFIQYDYAAQICVNFIFKWSVSSNHRLMHRKIIYIDYCKLENITAKHMTANIVHIMYVSFCFIVYIAKITIKKKLNGKK